ncbi:MAG: 4Fe-4S dicluster domain-containing protein [Candidatus Omnitrophota bacterium]
MERMFITEENLKVLVKNLKKDCDEFIAPRREHLDEIIFGDTKADAETLLSFDGNSTVSPKAFLLPQTEVLFEITSAKDCDLVPEEDKRRRIFYGVRPCDIKALTLMRKFFVDESADQPYQQKLQNSIFIALSCNQRCSDKSFCFEMSAGPFAKEGFDLQLTKIEKGYMAEIGSTPGAKIILRHKKLFSKAAPAHREEVEKITEDFAKDLTRLDYKRLAGIMEQEKIKESVWDDLGLRCVVCSGCITLCPTCSCFSIADRLNANKGVRLRYCDGCPYAGFTRMAGGSTPYPGHKDHIRRFFEHKLNVDVGRYGTPSCVGCGRCIGTCPGNISIRKFIDDAMEASIE